MIVLGLTGSIGMGKSTTADMFRQAGVPVYDSDAAVAAAYAPGGVAVAAVAEAFPAAIRDGAVDRGLLSSLVVDNPDALKRLETVVHPLLSAGRDRFLAAAAASGATVAVLDVPLLYEVNGPDPYDAVVVVSVPEDVQRARVLARPGMTAEKLDFILSRQLPDAQKRARADFIIDTGQGLERAREQVAQVLATVRAPGWRGGDGGA